MLRPWTRCGRHMQTHTSRHMHGHELQHGTRTSAAACSRPHMLGGARTSPARQPCQAAPAAAARQLSVLPSDDCSCGASAGGAAAAAATTIATAPGAAAAATPAPQLLLLLPSSPVCCERLRGPALPLCYLCRGAQPRWQLQPQRNTNSSGPSSTDGCSSTVAARAARARACAVHRHQLSA